MTNTAAWQHDLPCLNPACKSHGKPHPNCRCYGMAEGGEVKPFCSEHRSHEPECEYFAEGGEAVPAFDDIPDSPVQAVPQAVPAFDDLPDESTAQKIPAFNDLPDESHAEQVPAFDDLPDENKYATTGQRVLGDAEAAGKGLLGPIPTFLETKVLGMNPEDIKGRADTEGFPGEHATIEAGALGASLLSPYGPAKGAMQVIAHAVPEAVKGAQILRTIIQGASLAGSDEITKNLLGVQGADPSEAVGTALLHMGANGLISGATHGVFNILGKGLDVVDTEATRKVSQEFLENLVKKAAKNPVGKAGVKVGEGILTYLGAKHFGDGDLLREFLGGTQTYEALRRFVQPWLEKIVGKPFSAANKYMSDVILKALSEDKLLSVPTAISWASKVTKGSKASLPLIESLFQAGNSQIVPAATDSVRDYLRDNIEEGTPQLQIENESQNQTPVPTGYAKGGVVQHKDMQNPGEHEHFGNLYPEANILLNQAKGRIYGYLNSIRPLPDPQKLPFDKPMKDKQKENSYRRALDLAVSPLRILNHVNQGNLTPEDMKHFTQMYPEAYGVLSKKITERIAKSQLKGEMPSYSKRQSMSLFLGAPLDGTFTPQAIQATQAVFAQKGNAQQPQGAPKGKKGTNSLGKLSQSYQTAQDSRQLRQSKV